MTDEIQLIGDDDDLAVIGNPAAVELFLKSMGLLSLSKELRLDRLGSALDVGAGVAQAASDVAANSGRYVKLTKESAEQVKALGLMKTKTPGVSHAMLGEPGAISKWLQIEDGPGSLLANPALLSGVAGIMSQLAKQAEANELKEPLVKIDEKLDDVRRAQRDSVLAKMDRATFAIKEAMTIREYGGNRETAWVKVIAESGTIAEVQGSALRALDALADKVDGKNKVGDLARATQDIESEVGVWLAVLARCFQLQDEFAVLEIDHVFDTAPADLDGHRLGLSAAHHERWELIVEKTKKLMGRMDAAGGIADSNVILHVRAARTVVDSINSASVIVDDFHLPFGIESGRTAMGGTRWRDALRDPAQLKTAGSEAGRKALVGAGVAAATVVSIAITKNATKSSE